MTTVRVDDSVAGQLTGPAAIVDDAGKCLGFFLTREEFRERLLKTMAYDWEHETREEAMADIAKNGTYTSEEATAILEKALAERMSFE